VHIHPLGAVQWLIGRPLASGFSHAIATIWQSWSALIRAGVPGLAKSANRSSALKSVIEIPCNSSHRFCHKRTGANEMSNFLAISWLFLPVATSSTIRARKAIC